MTSTKPAEILVLGATGTVGGFVAQELIASGEVIRLGSRSKPARFPTIDFSPVDIATGQGLATAFGGIRKLFLATPHLDDQEEYEARIVEQAAKAGVTHIVKLSAFGAEREEYAVGRMHRSVERLIESSGMTWTFLRPTAFMQNFVTYYLPDIQLERIVRLPCGYAPISFIDAQDIASVATLALTEPTYINRSFEMFGPQALTYADATEIISHASGLNIAYKPISDEEYRLSAGGAPGYDRVLDLYSYYRSGHAWGTPFNMQAHTGRQLRSMADFANSHRDKFLRPAGKTNN